MTTNSLKQQLLERWPDARRIVHEGRCGCCGSRALYSFQLPGDVWESFDEEWEGCGYWCGCCGFASAGSRQPSRVRFRYRDV